MIQLVKVNKLRSILEDKGIDVSEYDPSATGQPTRPKALYSARDHDTIEQLKVAKL